MAGQLWTNTPWGESVRDIKHEFEKWGVRDYTISRLEEARAEGKVVISWTRNGVTTTLPACLTRGDRYDPATSIRGLYQVIAATRLADQRGIGALLAEAAARLALPPGTQANGKRSAYSVLGVPEGLSDRRLLVLAFKDARRKAHPDAGGTNEAFKEVMEVGVALGLA